MALKPLVGKPSRSATSLALRRATSASAGNVVLSARAFRSAMSLRAFLVSPTWLMLAVECFGGLAA